MTAQPIQTWYPDDSTFGARLALLRQHQGWGNIKEAALACGQPVESWRSWEVHGRTPRDFIAICQTISSRTGVDLQWLLGLGPTGGAGTYPTPPGTGVDTTSEQGEHATPRYVAA